MLATQVALEPSFRAGLFPCAAIHTGDELMPTVPTVIFSHGLEGTPSGRKARALARVTREHCLGFDALDYRGMDDPGARVRRLVADIAARATPVILVGSSVGGHVAASAALERTALGLFLLAPTFYMAGFEALTPAPAACPTVIVHGWRDEVVPVEHSVRFARAVGATLHVVDGDHRMLENIDEIGVYYGCFLDRLGYSMRGDRTGIPE